MEKIRRNERMSAMLKILTDAPNHIFTLSYFCEKFGAAKSTMSEDIDILRQVMQSFGLGELTTVTGAAGGVRYRARVTDGEALSYVQGLCDELSGTDRVLPGDFLYYSDILSDPESVQRMGAILATRAYHLAPDFVLTMETMGIPVAMTTAHTLGVPLVIARHTSKVYEGPAVNINYVSGSSGHIQTMSLNRRAVERGRRALIVDDFLKGGGTAKGMVDLMHEFDVTVVGKFFTMATAEPAHKRISDAHALMILSMSEDGEQAQVRPSPWLNGEED